MPRVAAAKHEEYAEARLEARAFGSVKYSRLAHCRAARRRGRGSAPDGLRRIRLI